MPDRKLRPGEELISPLHRALRRPAAGWTARRVPRTSRRQSIRWWVVTRATATRARSSTIRASAATPGRLPELCAKRTGSSARGDRRGTQPPYAQPRPAGPYPPALAGWPRVHPAPEWSACNRAYRTDHRGIAGRHGRPRTGRPDGRLRDPADHRGGSSSCWAFPRPSANTPASPGSARRNCCRRRRPRPWPDAQVDSPARAARGRAAGSRPTTSTAGWCRPPTRAAS